MERDNFYILLELPFDPPATEEAVIKEALRKKKQEWTRLQDNPVRRAEALRNLGLAQEIEKVLTDPALRKKEAKEACALRDEKLRQFEAELRLLEGKGYLQPKEAAAIVIRYKAYGFTQETLEERVAVPITETAPEQEEDGAGEMIDSVLADNIQRHLSALGFADLYAFLEEAPYASLKKLTEAAEKKRKEASSGGHSTQSTLVQELSGICLGLFDSFDSKQRYDRYRRISLYPQLNRLVDEEMSRSKYISPTALVRLVNFGVETFSGKVLEMEEYIRRYCAAMEYPVETQSLLVSCPSCNNKTPRDGAACTVCGAPLQGECPGCGTAFSGGVAACGECGFSIGNMGQALRHIAEAESALIDNNWSTAERALQYAKKLWPGHPMLEVLEKRAKLLEERYARYVDSVRDCVEHNQYYAALELIQEAQGRRIRLPGSTVSHVEGVIAELEESIERIRREGGEPSFTVLYKLASKVSDSIDLGRLMAEYPPDPPERLTASVKGRVVRVEWMPSDSAGSLNYVLVRKTGSRPLTAFDGDVLYEGPACIYVDKSASILQEQYYSVYTRRGISYSREGCSAAPVRIVPAVENLRITPADQGAQLTWDFNPEIREVQIYRKLGGERPNSAGEGIRLETDRLDGYSDTRIKNDVEYWYYLVALYVVDGVKIPSAGVCDNVIPHAIVAPIEELDIARIDGSADEYVVNWHANWNGPDTDVLLLASPKPPQYRIGAIIPVSELLENFRRLDLDMRQGEGARFRHRFSGGIYIFAAVVYGRFATVGRAHYLVNVSPPRDVTWDIVGSDLFFNMKWPAGVEQMVVAYRFDHYPIRPEDPGAAVLQCGREQYDYDAGVVLHEPEQTVYYARVYSLFLTPSGEKAYSEGVDICIDNSARIDLFYRVEYSKLFFAKEGKLTLTLESTGDVLLPQVMMVGKIGRLPLQQTDGMPLITIEKETRIRGSVTFEYGTDPLPKDLYVRLFLRDEELYDKFRLIPTTKMELT